MKIYRLGILILYFIPVQYTLAQEAIGKIISDIASNHINDELSQEEFSVLIDELSYYYFNPIDLNKTNEEELGKLQFLNDFQIFTILKYREDYGQILSLKELILIPGIDKEDIYLLNYFLKSGSQPSAIPGYSSQRKIKFQFLNRYQYELPERLGFTDEADSASRFMGPRTARLLKSRIENNKGLSCGFTMESDAGEPGILKEGFDFYSFFIEIERKNQLLKKLILGDFRINSATGLVHGSGLSSKSSMVILKQKFNELKKYSSTGENGFYRGICSQIACENFTIIPYFSFQKISSNLSEEDDLASSIYSSGLHRNLKERSTLRNLGQVKSGVVNNLQLKRLSLSWNLNFNHFSVPFEYRIRPDRYSETSSTQNFLNYSLGFAYRTGKFHSFGEFALDKQFSHAFLLVSNFNIHPLLKMSLSIRNYSPEYISWNSSALSEKSGNRNEKGFYFGIESFPFRILKLSFYADYFRFPWLNYNDSSPYAGSEYLAMGEWTLSRSFILTTMLKSENSYISLEPEESNLKSMKEERSQRIVLKTSYQFSENTRFSNKLEIKTYKNEESSASGILIYQQFSKKFLNETLSFDLRYTLFDIPSWDVRIYNWEPGLLYTFSMPSYYQAGQSFLLNLNFKLKRIRTGIKYSIINYMNEVESGSGSDLRKAQNYHKLSWQWILKL